MKNILKITLSFVLVLVGAADICLAKDWDWTTKQHIIGDIERTFYMYDIFNTDDLRISICRVTEDPKDGHHTIYFTVRKDNVTSGTILAEGNSPNYFVSSGSFYCTSSKYWFEAHTSWNSGETLIGIPTTIEVDAPNSSLWSQGGWKNFTIGVLPACAESVGNGCFKESRRKTMHVINLCAYDLTGLDNPVGRVWQNSGISNKVTTDARIEMYVNGNLYQRSEAFRQYLRDMGLFNQSINFDISAKPGYKFDHYDQDGNTLKVYYIPYKYSIKFNGNGATSGSMSDQSMTYGTYKNLTANAFKKEYTVTFDGNGGTPASSSLTSSATFNGWEDRGTFKYPDDGSSWTYQQFDSPFYLDSYGDLFTNLISLNYDGVYVYDKYLLLRHYITFGQTEGRSCVGSTPGLYPDKAAVNNLSSDENGSVALYANWSAQPAITLPSATRTGYVFKGWYTAASGGTKVGDAGASYTPAAGTTLYGQWEPDKVNLTIRETGLSGNDSAVITVTASGSSAPAYVVSLDAANPSVTIKSITAGTYVIAEKGWSHAYTVETASYTKNVDQNTEVTFKYTARDTAPLHAEKGKDNWK